MLNRSQETEPMSFRCAEKGLLLLVLKSSKVFYNLFTYFKHKFTHDLMDPFEVSDRQGVTITIPLQKDLTVKISNRKRV